MSSNPTSKSVTIDDAWREFIQNTASNRDVWEAFQYAWSFREELHSIETPDAQDAERWRFVRDHGFVWADRCFGQGCTPGRVGNEYATQFVDQYRGSPEETSVPLCKHGTPLATATCGCAAEKATTDRAAIDAAALADAHRMYEAEHGEPFQSNGKG